MVAHIRLAQMPLASSAAVKISEKFKLLVFNMSEKDEDLFIDRFGDPLYISDSFLHSDRTNLCDKFNFMHQSRQRMNNLEYDIIRQQFIKLISYQTLRWEPVEGNTGDGIDVCGLSRRGDYENVAFMRLQPKSSKTSRLVPDNVEMLFHCVLGSVALFSGGRCRCLSKGNYITIRERWDYSIKCISHDQPSYLIFRLRNQKRKAPNL